MPASFMPQELDDDPVVLAKKRYAERLAGASDMRYEMIKGTDALQERYSALFNGATQPERPQLQGDARSFRYVTFR